MSPFQAMPIVTDDEISGDEKLRRVAKLVKDLRADLKEVNFLPHERNAAMEQLKVFGRSAANADPIFTQEGIEILTEHSFRTTSPTTSKAALQCLANALLSAAWTRQIFVNLGYSAKAVARLKNPKKDDELLMSRILFLTSYGTSQSFVDLIDHHHLADYINDNIARHVKRHTKITSKKPPDPNDDAALTETLKLFFNVTHFSPKRISSFNKSIPNIFKIISHRPSTIPPLAPPLNHLVNALLNFPLDDPSAAKKILPSKADLKPAMTILLSTLDTSLHSYSDTDLETHLMPLLTLLKRLSTSSPPEIQSLLHNSLMPPLNPDLSGTSDVSSQPLSLKLLSYLRAPSSSQVHDAISALLFAVSGRDAEKLVANFGIGFSSGFLLSRNGQMPGSPGYEESVRSLNSGAGSLSGSGRNSAATASRSSASTMSLGGLSPLAGSESRRGSACSPSPRPSIQRASGSSYSGYFHSPNISASSTTASSVGPVSGSGSGPAVGLGIGTMAELPATSSRITNGSTDSNSVDKVPDNYDIKLETRKAWKGGGGFKRPTATATSTTTTTAMKAAESVAAANCPGTAKRGSTVGLRKREASIDLAARVEKSLSEMTVLVLDECE